MEHRRRRRLVLLGLGGVLFLGSAGVGARIAHDWFAVPVRPTAPALADSSHFLARPQWLVVGEPWPGGRAATGDGAPGPVLEVAVFPDGLFAGDLGEVARARVVLDETGRVRELHSPDGEPVDRLLIPAGRIGSLHGARRIEREEVPLHRMPDALIDAVLLQEDRRFFSHVGIDPWRIAGAALANLRAGRVVEGGSTITQQLAKNMFLTRERSLERKLREARLALWLERRWSKARILEAYLNQVYLGQDGAVAIHGVAAASRHWFGKDVAELDLAECALVAGLLRGPSLYAPDRHPEAASRRRALALRTLRDAGRIDDEAWAEALLAPLDPASPRRDDVHGWFLDDLHREVRRDGEFGLLSDRGLRIITTEDAAMQEAATRVVREELARLEAAHPRLRRSSMPLEAALVALDPERGDVLALIGGRDRTRSRFHRALAARRQPGSVFKPLVALAALERAPAWSLESVLSDAPLRVQRPEGVWTPVNYDGRHRGDVTLAESIERSLNVPFVRLGQRLGAPALADVARRAGIESVMEPVPALALGASEVTLLEMTSAYAALANGGFQVAPRRIQLVLDPRSGRVVGEPVRKRRAFEPGPTRAVTQALRSVVTRGTARRLEALGVHAPVAGKTGTTSNERDAWFIGYTHDLVVGVWVGFDDGESIGLPGSRAALPIYAAFLRAIGRAGTPTEEAHASALP